MESPTEPRARLKAPPHGVSHRRCLAAWSVEAVTTRRGPIGLTDTIRKSREETPLSRWVVLLHVATAFWLVSGLAGRDVTLAKARRTKKVELLAELAELAGRFDRFAVVPGSIAVFFLGLITAWVQGRPFTGLGNWWLLTSLLLYLTLLPLVPFVFIPRGKVFDQALKDAVEEGRVTSELTAAFDDRRVRATRTYERLVIALVLVLMVTKPF